MKKNKRKSSKAIVVSTVVILAMVAVCVLSLKAVSSQRADNQQPATVNDLQAADNTNTSKLLSRVDEVVVADVSDGAYDEAWAADAADADSAYVQPAAEAYEEPAAYEPAVIAGPDLVVVDNVVDTAEYTETALMASEPIPAVQEPIVEAPAASEPVVLAVNDTQDTEEFVKPSPIPQEAIMPEVPEEIPAEEPAAQDPAAEEPEVVEEVISEEPAMMEVVDSVVEAEPEAEPVYEEPAVEEPVYEEPVVEEPAAEELAFEEPVAEEPVIEEPVVEEPVYEEPAVEEPVAEEPVEEEPEFVQDSAEAEDMADVSEEITEEPEGTELPKLEIAGSEESEAAEHRNGRHGREDAPAENVGEEISEVTEDNGEDTYDEPADDEFMDDQEEIQDEDIDDEEYVEEVHYEALPYDAGLGQAIVNYAASLVGVTPYVWAGNSLEEGTDCSGFTHLICAEFGIYVPRGSDEYQSWANVSYEDLQPGDIVVYRYGGHVAFYAGNDTIIHCSNEETGTKYSDLWYDNPTAYVRVAY